jgi:hypothetical protein
MLTPSLNEAMQLRRRAEADMRNLGFDPASDLD